MKSIFNKTVVKHFNSSVRQMREADVFVDRMIARKKRVSMIRSMHGTTVYAR